MTHLIVNRKAGKKSKAEKASERESSDKRLKKKK
jgi:hypothetical protein